MRQAKSTALLTVEPVLMLMMGCVAGVREVSSALSRSIGARNTSPLCMCV